MKFFETAPDVEVIEEVIEEIVITDLRKLIVFNDEVNSFGWVIDTLIDICGHSAEQAEQCTLIIHYKGKCEVKRGSVEELAPMRNAICGRGISAEVL